MKKKYLLLLVLTIILVALSTSGCAVFNSDEPPSQPPVNDSGHEEITADVGVGKVLDIRVEPSPGASLARGILLDRAIVKIGSLDRPAFNPWNDGQYYAGDRCLLVLGDMRNDTSEDLHVDFWAEGFDSDGRQVAWSISSGTIVGHVQLKITHQSSKSFEIALNWAENVQLIKIIAHSYDRPIPSPPESISD